MRIENKTAVASAPVANHFCPFKNSGCTVEERSPYLMKDHENICQYRPFICPRYGSEDCKNLCLKFGDRDNALNHLLLFHEATILYGPVQTVQRTLDTKFFKEYNFFSDEFHWPTIDIRFDGKHFLAEFFTIKARVSWSILLVDTEDEAKKYRARITCGPNKDREIEWMVPVWSVTQGKMLRDPANIQDRFLPSFAASEFKDIVDIDAGGSSCTFSTQYEILHRA